MFIGAKQTLSVSGSLIDNYDLLYYICQKFLCKGYFHQEFYIRNDTAK